MSTPSFRWRTLAGKLPMKALAFLSVLLFASSALGQEVITAVDTSTLKEGESWAVTKKNGVVTVRPLRFLTPGVTPTPNPNPTPNPGPLTPFQTEVQRLTKGALADGGTETTGAGISSVYSLAADALDAMPPTLDISVAADFVRRGTTAVVKLQKEEVAWTELSTTLDETITTRRAKGDLKTKEQFVAIFRDVAKGMDAATGFKDKPATVLTLKPNELGIFGNIDLAKLIELIKLIMELFKLFAPMVP